MPNYFIDVEFGHVDGLPEDAAHNTFMIASNDADEVAGLAAIDTALVEFYTATPPGATEPIAYYLSPALSRAANKWKINYYLMADLDPATPMGGPVAVTEHTLTPAAGDPIPLPSEVACCLSFHGAGTFPEESGADRPAARHRGRIYLGPLNRAVVTTGPNGSAVLGVGLRLAAAGAARGLADTDAINWRIWSRRGLGSYTVVGGFVDDAFDTQRRRGEAATTRTSW